MVGVEYDVLMIDFSQAIPRDRLNKEQNAVFSDHEEAEGMFRQQLTCAGARG
jgi:hypothetical protein